MTIIPFIGALRRIRL